MPSADITRCIGTDAPICSRCWRKQLPQRDGERYSWAQWTPNVRGRGWCEGLVERDGGNLKGEECER